MGASGASTIAGAVARLPNAERAYVQAAKLRDYSLNPDHPRGAAKARLFRAVLGFERDDWSALAAELVAGVATAPIVGSRSRPDGTVYAVLVAVRGRNGQVADVTTAWQLDADGAPRLVSAYLRR